MKPDVETSVRAFIETKRAQPMDWSGNDCLPGLAAPLARLISGNDGLFTAYTDKYSTAEGALKTFKASGFESLGDLVAAELREIEPGECQIGDIIAMPLKGTFKHTLGVFDGENYLIYAPFGLVEIDAEAVTRAFTARGSSS